MSKLAIRIKNSVNRSSRDVFFTKDFYHLGSRRAVSRVLRRLVEERFLFKISLGIYAKSKYMSFFKKRFWRKDFMELVCEVFSRLNIRYDLGEVYILYNSGMITQVPVKPVFEVFKQRIKRKIFLGTTEANYREVIYERKFKDSKEILEKYGYSTYDLADLEPPVANRYVMKMYDEMFKKKCLKRKARYGHGD